MMMPAPRLLANAAGGLVAVQPRHAHVHQDRLRAERLRDLHRLDAVVGGPHLVPRELEHHRHRGRRVTVVVHHQDATPWPGCALVVLFENNLASISRLPSSTGSRTVNVLPLPSAGALGRDGAAVHLDQPLDQRQPDAQAAGGALDAPVHLAEHVEDAAERLGRDADPVVADGDDDLRSLAARRRARCALRAACTWRCC